ncbi:MAG: hypothetical protein F6K42_07540 [Leptolyngbya sp. SIO1D8]|nr:hypothetical protein [Leptolyngbya sp. SIO1D8]
MTTATTPVNNSPDRKRLRTIVKRLVIELGYLEHCLAENPQDADFRAAVASLDTAIDRLNQHLANRRDRATRRAA